MHQLSTSYRRIARTVGALCVTLVAATACQNAEAATTPAATGTTGRAGASTPVVAARSMPGLPGALFYLTPEHHLVRLTPINELLPLGTQAWGADVSPDGRRVARIEQDGDVLVTDHEGDEARRIYRDAAPYGIGPAWSPDGTKLLIARSAGDAHLHPGLLNVATGRFTELPRLNHHLHLRWSGDGRSLAFTTGECRVLTSTATGTKMRVVPVLGDPSRKKNPSGTYACDVVSVNRDGTRLAVNLKGPSDPAGDIVGDMTANAVIDTATGATVALPVRGTVLAVLYRPDGTMLIRSRKGTATTLTVLGPDGTRVAKVTEPAVARGLELVAYTR
jgi:TolB protein